MNDEIVTKKLALYYHPLFQTLIQEWVHVFQINENAMDIVVFSEINLRIQKSILAEINLDNSLSSAITDWIRELESLMVEDPSSPAQQARVKKDFDPFKVLVSMVETVPFQLSAPQDAFTHLFKDQLHRLQPPFITDKMSFAGFGKFLFDLCYSWCEELDIELFAFFLIAVLYQMTILEFPGHPKIKSFDAISSIPDSLLTQIKLRKAHYNRYKKVDLSSYDPWYEWNYLPHRMVEVKTKAIEAFSSIFKEDQFISFYIEKIFRTSIQQINQKQLMRPTKVHFQVLAQENTEPEENKSKSQLNLNQSDEIEFSTDNSVVGKGAQKPSSKSHTRIAKRMPIPVFGKTIIKHDQEEPTHPIQIHTLKSIQSFLGDVDASSEQIGDDLKKQTQLYPIWEHDISETTSVATIVNSEKPNPLKLNKDIRNYSSEKAKRTISALKRKEEKSIRATNVWPREATSPSKTLPTDESFGENPPGFFRNLLPKGRLSVSPSLVEQTRKFHVISPSRNSRNISQPQGEKKLHVISSEKDVKTNGRTSAPTIKSKLRMTLNSANLFKEVLGEITSPSKRKSGDSKVPKYFGLPIENLNKSSTATNSKHRAGRVFKEMSFEEGNSSMMKQKGLNFTVVGRSTFQIVEDEDFLNSPTTNPYQAGLVESEKMLKFDKIIKMDKLEQFAVNRLTNLETPHKNPSSRPNKSPFYDISSPYLEEVKISSKKESPIQPIRERKKEGVTHIKLAFPKTTTASKSGLKAIKELLTTSLTGKDTKDLFERMQEKVVKNKKNQEVRMKRIKRPENKKMAQLHISEDRKNERLSPEFMQNLTEYSIH